MRVVILNSIRECGGGEKWLVRQAVRWRDRGHEPLVVSRPEARLGSMAAEVGLRHAEVAMPHDISPRAVLQIGGLLRRERPEVVLCCSERAFRLAVPASGLGGAPPIVYRNGLSATFKNRSINRLLSGRLARMVVNTEALRREMEAFGWIPPERVRVITNGIDTGLYRPDPGARRRVREELGCPPEAPVAAVLGRLTGDKGQVEAIRAADRLADQFDGLELWLAGEGSLRPRLEELAAASRVRVRFLGFRADVPALLQAVDVVLQPSFREGMANTVLEAMAAGRPVVGSRVGGIVDAIVPGRTGELVPPGDPGALAETLRPLLADPELRRQYGESGRLRAAEVFPLERETEAWCHLFEEVTSETTGRANHG